MEHEACGIGAVVNLNGIGDHRAVDSALTIVERLAHRAGIGVSVRKDYWRQGIADHMLQTLLDCARACGYEQVELEVVADNFRAVPLYMKHGFQVYGTRPHGLRYPDGSYASEYLMYKKL